MPRLNVQTMTGDEDLLERFGRGVRFDVRCDGRLIDGVFAFDTDAGMVESFLTMDGIPALSVAGYVGYRRLFGKITIRRKSPAPGRFAVDQFVEGPRTIPSGEQVMSNAPGVIRS